MKKNLMELNTKLRSLAIFRGILSAPVIMAFQELLDSLSEKDSEQQVSAYGYFVSSLYKETSNFSTYVNSLFLNDENAYVQKKAMQGVIPQSMEACLQQEIAVLEELSNITSADIKGMINYKGFLPDWENTVYDFNYDYQEKLHSLPRTGYGLLAKYSVFHLKDGRLTPVKYPDPQRLDQLFGYERERDLVIKNTEALLSGKGASNMLLYGDAGTGKSSTIKAVANHYAKDGLRLVEVKKHQLYRIPTVIEQLSANPLKFILYIDDLSFAENDDNFSALKAILEGSVSSFGNNIVIYATSNRRHLVKESMSQRAGDDLHLNDTLQETMSLAARFPLTITYQKPDKEEYLEIVRNLAAEYQLDIPEDELFKKAEVYALRASGRTPRAAKQFVELQKIGV